MKLITRMVTIAGVSILIAGLARGEQAAPHHEITMWVASPTGSHLGAGYASTYLTNIRAKTIGREDPKLREAINSLDGLGMLRVKGLGLLPAAVAWQSNASIDEVVEQQAETRLSYAELLMAHTLAAETNHDFNDIIAMRVHTDTWGGLMTQLGVDPGTIILRAHTASDRIRLADTRTRQQARPDSRLRSKSPQFSRHYNHY